MKTDIGIVLEDVSECTITYGGTIIRTETGSKSLYLRCANKVMSGNIGIAVVIGAPVVFPVKGDIIKMDLQGNGVKDSYTVLAITNGIAEVMAQTPYGSDVNYGSSQVYDGSNADTILNNTYYATLTSVAKAAIVDKTFQQDRWYLSASGNPDYIGTYNTSTSYTMSVSNLNWGSAITRHIYLISMKQIIEYLGVTPQMTAANTTLKRTNIRKLFNSSSGNAWLCTAYTANNGAFYATFSTGRIQSGTPGARNYSLYPTFQIDLSKITWSKD